MASSIRENNNFIGGHFVPSKSGESMEVHSPATGEVVATVALSGPKDVDAAVQAAESAFPSWSGMTVKHRASIMYKFHSLILRDLDELVELVVSENGKNRAEAVASVHKGNETVEWACSLPQLIQGKVLEVSRSVHCHEVKEPLGIVASVVPFNFPIMVPMWTVPIALTAGNCVIVKPSEKVPSTLTKIASLLKEAGIPDGVFQIIHGQVPAVQSLCDHPKISALTFVGSSKVAEIVAQRCHSVNKRVLALGGAKNHLIALDDCDPDMAAQDIVASFAGCAGQRCMAASALVLVGDQQSLLDKVVKRAAGLQPGQEGGQVGPIIDAASRDRILAYINEAEKDGAKVLLDGRPWATSQEKGSWVGPTVLLHSNPEDKAMRDEIFGPVLSVYVAKDWNETLAIENGNPHGNAASIYTSVGAHAEWWSKRFRAGMIGVNIGIPVPREPFSFGGMYGTKSKYGDFDVTGDGAMNFFTQTRKITTKWVRPGGVSVDKANFDGHQ